MASNGSNPDPGADPVDNGNNFKSRDEPLVMDLESNNEALALPLEDLPPEEMPDIMEVDEFEVSQMDDLIGMRNYVGNIDDMSLSSYPNSDDSVFNVDEVSNGSDDSEDHNDVHDEMEAEMATATLNVLTDMARLVARNAETQGPAFQQEEHLPIPLLRVCSGNDSSSGDEIDQVDAPAKVEHNEKTTTSLTIKDVAKPEMPDRLKQCNFCKQPGDLVCGGCYHVVYCSAEHQQTDWNRHQKSCAYYSLHRAPSVVYQGPIRFRELLDDRNNGFRMEALCRIPNDTTILEEKPFFVAPWPRTKLRKSETNITTGIRPLCLTCFGCCRALYFNFSTCDACNIPICSDGCPYIKKHKDNECQYMMQMQQAMGQPDEFDTRTKGTTLMDDQATELFYLDIMVLRFVLLYDKLKRECGDDEKWNEIWGRLTTTWKMSQSQRAHRSKRGALVFKNMEATLPLSYFITKGNTQVIWMVFCILEENMLVMDLPHQRMKVLSSAVINATHSCAPNSHAFLKNDNDTDDLENLVVSIVLGKEIDAGVAITISYCPYILPTTQRKPLLMDQYLFRCNCSRCLDPTECKTYINSFKCTFCGISYLIPPAALANTCEDIIPPNMVGPSYNWICGRNLGIPPKKICSSCNASNGPGAYRAALGSSVLLPKLNRLELESVASVGSYQKTQRFIETRFAELPPNSHIFLKLYDDILRGALYPLVGENGEHLSEFPADWLQCLRKAKEAYSSFMDQICPAFNFQGFPLTQITHMLTEIEFRRSNGGNNAQDIRTILLRPSIRNVHGYMEITRPRVVI